MEDAAFRFRKVRDLETERVTVGKAARLLWDSALNPTMALVHFPERSENLAFAVLLQTAGYKPNGATFTTLADTCDLAQAETIFNACGLLNSRLKGEK